MTLRIIACEFLLVALLGACSLPPPAKPACPPVKQWSDKEEDQMLLEEQKLKKASPNSILIAAFMDYDRLRKEVSACQ
jgi:hypothetical protein